MNNSASLSLLLQDISKPKNNAFFQKTTDYEQKVGVSPDEISANLSIIASTDYENSTSSIIDVNKSFVVELNGTSYFFIYQTKGENGVIQVFRTHPSNKAYNFQYIGSCSSNNEEYVYIEKMYQNSIEVA